MTSFNLPPAIGAALAARLDSAKRAPLRSAHDAMSALYRGGGHTRDAVSSDTAALAYAVARMPATYAACTRAFDLVAALAQPWAPASLLDLGSGPGTAALAATAVWPTLRRAVLVEPNAMLRALAHDLIATSPLAAIHAPADIAALPSGTEPADLVTLSYVLAEQSDTAVAALIAAILPLIRHLVVIVEPGTPAGYARIIEARRVLIASGLRIVAPCPHGRPCPLEPGNWCHFGVRLQRSAAHMQLKDATVPFEDEKMSFVAAVGDDAIAPAAARLIAPVVVEKGFVDLDLCTTAGREHRRIRRRDRAAYKAAKSLAWGDAAATLDALAEPDAS